MPGVSRGGDNRLPAQALQPAQPAAPAATQSSLAAADPQFNPASVDRGQQLLVSQCGFCHGSNARGGSSGPDLTRSALVQDDEGDRQLGEFLRAGRPDKGMPAFQLDADQVTDLATFLRGGLDSSLLTKIPTDSWPTYHGDYSGRRYSTLTQITADNVKNLQLAWVYRLNTSQALANIGGEGPDVPPAAAGVAKIDDANDR